MQSEAAVGCFGKVPALGDFLHFNYFESSVQDFDRWVQQGMYHARERFGRQLSQLNQTAPAYRFFFTPLQKGLSVVGVLRFSWDRHLREFPLVCFSTQMRDDASRTWTRLPVGLQGMFHAFSAIGKRAVAGLPPKELTEGLKRLAPVACPRRQAVEDYGRFLSVTPIGNRWTPELLISLASRVRMQRTSSPRLWNWGVRVQLSGPGPELEWEVGFWLEFISALIPSPMGGPAAFWTDGVESEERPNLLMFFREPSPQLFPFLYTTRAVHDLLWHPGQIRSSSLADPLPVAWRAQDTLAEVLLKARQVVDAR